MRGRFTATAAFDGFAERFGITVESGANEELTGRYNVAPTQAILIITASAKGRRLVIAEEKAIAAAKEWIDKQRSRRKE